MSLYIGCSANAVTNVATFAIGFYALCSHRPRFYDIFSKLLAFTLLISQVLCLIAVFHLLEVAVKAFLLLYLG